METYHKVNAQEIHKSDLKTIINFLQFLYNRIDSAEQPIQRPVYKQGTNLHCRSCPHKCWINFVSQVVNLLREIPYWYLQNGTYFLENSDVTESASKVSRAAPSSET